MNTVELDVRLSLKEYFKYSWMLTVRNPVVYIGVIGLAVWFGVTLHWFALIPVTLFFFFLYVAVYFNVRREFHSNKGISGIIHYKFAEDGFDVTTQDGSTAHLTWNTVLKFKESKDAIIIHHSNRLVRIIPKAEIDQSKITILRDILNSNVV